MIPARFLKVSRAEGLGDTLFRDLRFDADGKPRPDFPLNDPARKGASILIGRKNFGVGSSREAAVYALVDHGFRCVVATSFGDIFAGNAVNNGLVAAIVSEEDIEKLLVRRRADRPRRGRSRSADHQVRQLRGAVHHRSGAPDAAAQRLGRSRSDGEYKDQIEAFAAKDRAERPWAVPRA